MFAHGDGQFNENGGGFVQSQQSFYDRRAVWRRGGGGAEEFGLVAFEDGDVGEFRGVVVAGLFDDEEAGGHYFENEAGGGKGADGAPDGELAVVAGGHAQVDSGALDGGGKAGESGGVEGDAAVKENGVDRLFRGQVREGDCRREAFFAAEAGPEGGIDHLFDGWRAGMREEGMYFGGDVAGEGEFSGHSSLTV